MTGFGRSDTYYIVAAGLTPNPHIPSRSNTPAGLSPRYGPAGPLLGSKQIDAQPTSVRLEKSLRESLKRLAKERRWSMSVLIQQVLEAFVRAEDKKKK